MRPLRRCILMFWVSTVAISCAPAGQRPVSVTAPTQRLEFQGFSILPPKGKNWNVIDRATDRVMFEKILVHSPIRTHRILASVGTSVVPLKDRKEVLQRIERKAQEEVEKNATAIEEMRKLLPATVFKVSLDSSLGSECLRQDVTIPEQDVPGGPILVQTMHGFSCPHPDMPGYIIELGYSQRFSQGEQPVPWEAEAEPFFKSLVFNRITP